MGEFRFLFLSKRRQCDKFTASLIIINQVFAAWIVKTILEDDCMSSQNLCCSDAQLFKLLKHTFFKTYLNLSQPFFDLKSSLCSNSGYKLKIFQISFKSDDSFCAKDSNTHPIHDYNINQMFAGNKIFFEFVSIY